MMVIRKLFFVSLCIVSLFLLVSCGSSVETLDSGSEGVSVSSGAESGSVDTQEVESEVNEENVVVDEELEDSAEEEVIEAVLCSDSSECEWNEQCIDGECGFVSSIYDTQGSCDLHCNFDNVIVTTSDGEELTLSRGTGSYTAAGALEWKLLSSSDYCRGEDDTPVAIEIIKKNLGEVVGREIIVLDIDEESKVITHPTISRVSFTLEVQDYEETCE